MKATVTVNGLRVRDNPKTGNVIANLAQGTQVEVISDLDGWSRIGINSPGVIIQQPVFVSSTYLKFDNPNKYKIGMHFINDHQAAREMLGRGLPVALVMNGKTSANQLAKDFPSALIVYRRDHSGQSASQMFNDLEVSANDPGNLYYVGANEGATNSEQTITDRFNFDRELAGLINQRRNTNEPKYLAFSGGHGNPAQIEEAWMQSLMRNTYAKAYNDGLFQFDCHDYTCGTYPREGAYVKETKWYETRTNWLFTHCGFNPKIKRIWHCESGIEGGCGDKDTKPGTPGGFLANNYSFPEMREHLRRQKEIQSAKILVGGVEYDSPNVCDIYFQGAKNDTQWAGYGLSKYYDLFLE